MRLGSRANLYREHAKPRGDICVRRRTSADVNEGFTPISTYMCLMYPPVAPLIRASHGYRPDDENHLAIGHGMLQQAYVPTIAVSSLRSGSCSFPDWNVCVAVPARPRGHPHPST
jgi:hypothetical protein